jgi:hypothetical protein
LLFQYKTKIIIPNPGGWPHHIHGGIKQKRFWVEFPLKEKARFWKTPHNWISNRKVFFRISFPGTFT